jgi:hypothetical protein
MNASLRQAPGPVEGDSWRIWCRTLAGSAQALERHWNGAETALKRRCNGRLRRLGAIDTTVPGIEFGPALGYARRRNG